MVRGLRESVKSCAWKFVQVVGVIVEGEYYGVEPR
jgi:hypothetical protein